MGTTGTGSPRSPCRCPQGCQGTALPSQLGSGTLPSCKGLSQTTFSEVMSEVNAGSLPQLCWARGTVLPTRDGHPKARAGSPQRVNPGGKGGGTGLCTMPPEMTQADCPAVDMSPEVASQRLQASTLRRAPVPVTRRGTQAHRGCWLLTGEADSGPGPSCHWRPSRRSPWPTPGSGLPPGQEQEGGELGG